MVLLGSIAPVTAATTSEFYAGLLRRGIASYESNRYPDAARQLRIAAFGLVDSVEQYQLAQMYLALTSDKLGQSDRAREAARRVVVAERVQRKYAVVNAPSGVRSAFEVIAGRLLSPADVAGLRGEGALPPPAPPSSARSPRVTTTNRQGTTTPRETAPTETAPQTPRETAPSETAPRETTSRETTPRETTPAQTTTQERVPQQTTPRTTTPQTTTPQSTAPQTTPAQTKPAPAPVKSTPPKSTPPKTTTPPATQPAPRTTTPPQQTTTVESTPAQTTTVAPQTQKPKPAPAPAPVKPLVQTPAATPTAPRPLTASEVAAKLAASDRALNGANLVEARRGYRELLAAAGLDHETLIRVAEGLYRSRDFSGALATFGRIGTLRRGEEPYRYYIAVAAYETGDYARAKKELASALPFIEITPDVARYQTRIDGAQ